MRRSTSPFASSFSRMRQERRVSGMSAGGAFVRMAVLLLFALFFGVPLVWLLLAPSKTDPQLFDLNPLAFAW